MKRAIFVLAAVGLLTGLTGCTCPHGRCFSGLFNGSCQNAPEDCASCGGGGACAQRGAEDPGAPSDPYADGGYRGGCRQHGGAYAEAQGPPTAAITYPYYTTRGPRDFLARNPQSIGP